MSQPDPNRFQVSRLISLGGVGVIIFALGIFVGITIFSLFPGGKVSEIQNKETRPAAADAAALALKKHDQRAIVAKRSSKARSHDASNSIRVAAGADLLQVGSVLDTISSPVTTAPSAPVAVPASISVGVPFFGVTGNLNAVGSDSLVNLISLWAEDFKAQYPNVTIQIEAKGNATAPPALVNGTAQLALMSRPMKPSEMGAFEAKFGYKPTEIKVCIDAIAVFTHKDNPVIGLSLAQVDGIFSSTLKRGGADISNWGQAGLGDDWVTRSVSLYGRNSASAAFAFFKETILNKGDYKTSVKEQAGSSALVAAVAGDLGGIGYSGIGYRDAGVKPLALSAASGAAYYAPTYENCLSGDYPLSRGLLIYVNKRPGSPADLLTRTFLKFALSDRGQQDVVKAKFFPLPEDEIVSIGRSLE